MTTRSLWHHRAGPFVYAVTLTGCRLVGVAEEMWVREERYVAKRPCLRERWAAGTLFLELSRASCTHPTFALQG